VLHRGKTAVTGVRGGGDRHHGDMNIVLASWRALGRWLAPCEACFLGRGRLNATEAVRDATRAQATAPPPRMDDEHGYCVGWYEPPLSELVRAVKMQRWSRVGVALGGALGRCVARRMREDSIRAASGSWIVVPIPTPFHRRLRRGIDHADVIAAAVAREVGIPLRRALRQRLGRAQKSLNRSARLDRRDRFVVRGRHRAALRGASVVLVDDIQTTGATLRQAAQVLRMAGVARIMPAVVCRVERRRGGEQISPRPNRAIAAKTPAKPRLVSATKNGET
jgi:ComF family protein